MHKIYIGIMCTQSDRRLCYLLIGKYHIKPCYKRKFNFLASLCSLGNWFESRFVGNTENRFSSDEAYIIHEVETANLYLKQMEAC